MDSGEDTGPGASVTNALLLAPGDQLPTGHAGQHRKASNASAAAPRAPGRSRTPWHCAGVSAAAQTDPREREDWFRRLPPAVQEQTRAKWQAQEQRGGPHAERHRRFRIRSILEGLVLMGLVQGFFGSASVFMILPAAAMGGGIGFLWYLMRAGPMLCILSSGLSWTLLLVFDPLGMTTLIKSVVVLCTLAAVIGIGRESWYRSDAIGW